jgi:hypothetical protein
MPAQNIREAGTKGLISDDIEALLALSATKKSGRIAALNR